MHRIALVLAFTTVAALGAGGCSDPASGTTGTGAVSGTVVEEQTFTPVVDARVEVAGSSAWSEATGAFRLTRVATGSYTLTVTAAGYLPHTRTVDVVAGENDLGQLWLKRAGGVGDGGAAHDAGVADAPVADGGAADAPPHDTGQADARQDAAPTDAHLDAPPQADAGQSDGPCQTGYHRCATGCCPWLFQELEAVGTGEQAAIKLDTSGRPHLLYGDDANARLRYARWDGSSWSYETVATGKPLYVSLTLDSANRPRAAWVVDNGFESLNYSSRATGSWATTTIDNRASFCNVNVDGAGTVHVGYRESQNQVVKHSYSTNDTTFMVENVDTAGNPGWYTAMDVSAAGAIHLVYFTDQNELRYARKDTTSTGWTKQVIDAIPYSLGASSASISLDSSGVPHVAYRDYGSPSQLKYSVLMSGTWQIVVLQDHYALGSVSIATSPVGLPQVVTWDQLNADLVLGDVTTGFVVLDDNKRPGLHGRALAVDSTGSPHIVYTTHTTPRQVGYVH